MTSLSMKDYNEDIDYRVEKVKAIRQWEKNMQLEEEKN